VLSAMLRFRALSGSSVAIRLNLGAISAIRKASPSHAAIAVQEADEPTTSALAEVGLVIVSGQFGACRASVLFAAADSRVGDLYSAEMLPNTKRNNRVRLLADRNAKQALTLDTRIATLDVGPGLHIDAGTCSKFSRDLEDELGLDGSRVEMVPWLDEVADADLLVSCVAFDRGRTGWIANNDFRAALKAWAASGEETVEELTDDVLDQMLDEARASMSDEEGGIRIAASGDQLNYLTFMRAWGRELKG